MKRFWYWLTNKKKCLYCGKYSKPVWSGVQTVSQTELFWCSNTCYRQGRSQKQRAEHGISPVEITDEIKKAAFKATAIIEQAMIREYYRLNKAAQAQAQEEKEKLFACFPLAPVLFEPIPNRYCSLACCEHLPWFKATGNRGIITIGWRKRVIVIDWSESLVQIPAEQLFPDYKVTKYDRLIHAWSYEQAQEFLAKIYNPIF